MLQHKDHVEMDTSSQIENIQQQWRNVYESLLQ
jgi:hypothetical protein